MAKRKIKPTPVEAIRHKDKRANIPTEELRDFVADEEQAPKTMLYPRDPSLDPQLVWKGKDDQDRADLAVPVVPIYIQEKIQPQAIIAGLPRAERGDDAQLNLFADFNGLPEDFERRIDFYHHEGHWSNRMILGDSLLVMTSLAEKEGLKGKVQTIYLDPPYGIKFGSNWQVSTRKRDVKDGKAEDATRQPEQIRAFRDTWQFGVNSYLATIRDRLFAARELLSETGSVFVQIGDENVHLVRSLLDEVFGSENIISLIPFKKTTGQTTAYLPGTCDYLIWYAKDESIAKYRPLYRVRWLGGDGADAYTSVELTDGSIRRILPDEFSDPRKLPSGSRPFRYQLLQSQREGRPSGPGTAMYFEVTYQGKRFSPSGNRGWTTTREGMDRLRHAGRLAVQGTSLSYVRYLDDFPAVPLNNLWEDTQSGSGMDKIYVVQTNVEVIRRSILMTTDPGDLVLDPTCGSGTTAYVAEQWGRRWITIDTSRVALALARTRLMSAKYPYYLLADSPEGIAKEAEVGPVCRTGPEATGNVGPARQAERTSRSHLPDGTLDEPPDEGPARQAGPTNDVRKGFVYKRVPHVTLKSIANNPDIREGMTREQIDAAIVKHAETETLFDQPYEDNKRIRVSGPFTVESLSPHRVLSTDDVGPACRAGPGPARQAGPTTGNDYRGSSDFAAMILDNLRKAGVQNTRKAERLKFDRLDPFAGAWIHATGEFTDADGKTKRVAVSIGPEHGTVGPQQVKEAAKEAVQGIGFDVLVVCGFAFDPHVSEEAKRYGKLVVLPTKMNPDLAMGDALLKNTGAGNLFMVFGEPDVEISRVGPVCRTGPEPERKTGPARQARPPEQLTVEIKGVDVYDPTTGQIRNSSTADIACWFIDTAYNGESFFVRHAYFTGADEPYDKLKRALRAEIDEAAWSSLYSTKSRPFPRPETGKIAVKVINHYGDEVLKVFDV